MLVTRISASLTRFIAPPGKPGFGILASQSGGPQDRDFALKWLTSHHTLSSPSTSAIALHFVAFFPVYGIRFSTYPVADSARMNKFIPQSLRAVEQNA